MCVCNTHPPTETCASLVDPCSRARRLVGVRFVTLRGPSGEGAATILVRGREALGVLSKSGSGIRGLRLWVARRFPDAKLIPERITSAACGVLVLAWTRLLDLREDQRTGPSRGTSTTWTSGEVDCLS